MITINGVKISDSVHQKFKEDFPVYREIIGEEEEEKEEYNDISLPQIIHHQAVLFNLVISKAQIQFLTNLLKSGTPTNVFQLTEPLDYLMSEKNMAVVVKTIAEIIKCNPNTTNYIENMEDLSSLEKLSLESIHEKYRSRSSISSWNHISSYRFSDNVWIMIKIALFKYKIVRTFGLSHVNLYCLNYLALSEKPQCVLDELVRSETINYPIKISGTLHADNTFDLGNCSMEYRNGNSYQGNIIVDKDIGYLRHGDNGSFYSSDNILEHHGRYVYDFYDYGCDSNRDDVICHCDLCFCKRRASNYESMFEEEEEEDDDDDQACCSRENYNYHIPLVTSVEPFRIRHCEECTVGMWQHCANLRVRKMRYWNKILDLNLTESQIYNKMLFEMISKSHVDPLADIYIKSIENYQDYFQYIEPSPKIIQERARYLNEKLDTIIDTIDREYF